MMTTKDTEDFKVIDRRGVQSEPFSEKKETKSELNQTTQVEGDGFIMKDNSHSESSTIGSSQIDFSTIILSLATNAYIQLGLTPDPSTNQTQVNLESAKQTIELLSVLKEKTINNLLSNESELLIRILTDLRLQFVEIVKQSVKSS